MDVVRDRARRVLDRARCSRTADEMTLRQWSALQTLFWITLAAILHDWQGTVTDALKVSVLCCSTFALIALMTDEADV